MHSKQFGLAVLGYDLIVAKGDVLSAVEIAKIHGHEREELVLRAAVNAGTTSDPDWAGNLIDYRTISNGFVDYNRSRSAFDSIAPAAIQLPAKVRVAVASTAISGTAVAQSAPKPVSRLVLDGFQIEPTKCVGLVVVTNEILRFSAQAAIAMLQRELSAASVQASDSPFLSGIAADLPTSNIFAAGSDFLGDLHDAASLVAERAAARLFIVVPPAVAVDLAADERDAFAQMTPTGGTVRGIPVIVSDNVPDGSWMLIDAASLAVDPGIVTLRVSTETSLLMDDDPADGAQQHVSMFQTNSTALMAERWIAYQRLRDSAVAVVTAADYSPNGG